MAVKKITRPKAAKSAAGSALSQTKAPKKVTSKKVASSAGQVLSNPKSTKSAKSAAASALSQRQVKAPAKKGKVSSAAIKKAVKIVRARRK